MKLNPDCIRDTLLYLEEKITINFQQNSFNSVSRKQLIEEMMLRHTQYDADEIWYAIYNLKQAGYIEGRFIDVCTSKMVNCEIENITWEGHQFLDSVRPDSIWCAVKTKANQIGGISISGLNLIASSVIKGMANNTEFIQSIIDSIPK